MIPPIFENIPAELKAIPHWILWKPIGGKKKLPVRVDGSPASSTDPATWTSFSDIEINSGPPWREEQFGIGFVLSSDINIIAIDIDDCVKWEKEKPIFDNWALAVMDKLGDVYVEFSPSRKGLRIFCNGSLKENRRYDRAKIEIYSNQQYVTVTGDTFNAGPIEERQAEIEEIISKLDSVYRLLIDPQWQQASRNFISVEERLKIAFASENGEKIKRLFDGDCSDFSDSSEDGVDRSAADFSLCRRLCFYSDGNPGLLTEMMLQSGLQRPKWQRRLGTTTYLENLIQKCIATERKFYTAPAIITPLDNRPLEKKNRYMLSELQAAALVYRKRSDIYGLQCQYQNLNKIYRPRPGLLSVWTGKPGAGKSTFILSYLLDFAIRNNIRAGLCSFELNPPERLLLELVAIFGKCNPFDDSMDDARVCQIVSDLKNICTVFSLDFNQRSVDGIEPLVEQEIAENGMGVFYLDPFTELQPADRLLGKYTDFAGQQLSKLKAMTEEKDLITHLVCHPTKQGSSRSSEMTLADINGSGDFERKADFGIVISREKGSKITVVHLQKLRDRFTGAEDGKAAFELDQDCQYFREVSVPISLRAEKKDSDVPF